MKVNGNLEVLGFANIKIPVLNDYTFDPSDKGKLFATIDGELKFNNGDTVVTVIDEKTSTQDIRVALGTQWVNSDGSFNPTNFNNSLQSILSTPLNGNNSLYDVLTTMASAINEGSSVKKYKSSFSGSSSYNVVHNLNDLYCSITVVEGTKMVPSSEYVVEYTTANSFNISFAQNKNVTIIVIS